LNASKTLSGVMRFRSATVIAIGYKEVAIHERAI